MKRYHFLKDEEMFNAVTDRRNYKLVIGGVVDSRKRTVTVIWGNTSIPPSIIPFKWFTPNPTAKLDFTDFEVIDSGLSIRLGNYEVGTDSIY